MAETIVETEEKIKKKRGRKPSGKRKGYFYEQEEEAFVKYLKTTDIEEKNRIFDTILKPAFTKMTESIIRRYNLYPPDEMFEETFDDTMSFLITKIENFNPESGYKAYSYCGTIIKNYLIYKINQFVKNQKRNTSYDAYDTEELSDLTDTLRYSYDGETNNIAFLGELMKKTAADIEEIVNEPVKNKLNENQIKVGKALVEILNNWEELFAQMGSNKFNKSSILLFLKETTLLNTKEIRDAMKQYRSMYYIIKDTMINE
jgi:hypothetical protein